MMTKKHIKTLLLLTILTAVFSSCAEQRKHKYMDKMYTEVKDALPDAQVQIVEDSIQIIFKGASFFDVGSYDLMESTYPLFTRFGNVLKKYDRTQVLILGHTDNVGDPAKNLELSDKRAYSAKQRLLDEEISPKRLSAWGLGESDPIADNGTEEGQAKNRRLEFVILYQVNKEK